MTAFYCFKEVVLLCASNVITPPSRLRLTLKTN